MIDLTGYIKINKEGIFKIEEDFFYIEEPIWMIVKIRTTEGYKVGMARDLSTGLEDYEELLEEKRYTEKEAELRVQYWCRKLGLDEFKWYEHTVEHKNL